MAKQRRYFPGPTGGSLFRKHGVWYARVRVGGKRHFKRAGADKAQAWDVLAALVARHRDRLEVTTPGTFRDLHKGMVAYFEREHGPGTFRRERKRIDRLVEHFGAEPVDTIDSRAVERFLSTLRDQRGAARGGAPRKAVSGATIDRYRSCLSMMFEYAIAEQRATVNPAARRPKQRKRTQRPDVGRYLTDEEVARIVAQCPTKGRQRDGFNVLIRILADCGLRRSEGLALTWRDVDLAAEPAPALTVRRSKSGKPRVVPMTDGVVEALTTWRSESRGATPIRGADLVFPRLASPGMETSVSLRFNRAARRSRVHLEGIPDDELPKRSPVRLHDLRHAYGARLAQLNVPIPTIAALMGHDSLATTMRYARHAPSDSRFAAVAALNEARGTQRGTRSDSGSSVTRAKGSKATG